MAGMPTADKQDAHDITAYCISAFAQCANYDVLHAAFEILKQQTIDHLAQVPWLPQVVDIASLSAQQYVDAQQVARLTEQQMAALWWIRHDDPYAPAPVLAS